MIVQPDVVVAMSGGVDSSVAAALLVEEGYCVRGMTLDISLSLGEHASGPPIERAQEVAETLKIPFSVVDARDRFQTEVIEHFISEYAAGRTPNPCVRCNRLIRFGWFLDQVRAQGARWLATGHYARIRRQDREWQLLRGSDRQKDQSYFLHTLTQQQLPHILFPVGDLTKKDVRRIARDRGLVTADRPESQDICFLASDDYRTFLRQVAPEIFEPGPILDTEGNVLGRHEGLPGYTIGQRKGLGITSPAPLYVLAIEPDRNALIVGTADQLGRKECFVEDMHFVNGRPPDQPFRAMAQIRYRARPTPVTVTRETTGRDRVRFDHPQRDLTPGQFLVLYEGEITLGGGMIAEIPPLQSEVRHRSNGFPTST